MPVQSTPGILVTMAPSVSGGPEALMPLPRPQPGTVVLASPPPVGTSDPPQATVASASQQRRIARPTPDRRARAVLCTMFISLSPPGYTFRANTPAAVSDGVYRS